MKGYLKDIKTIWQWIYTVPEKLKNCHMEKKNINSSVFIEAAEMEIDFWLNIPFWLKGSWFKGHAV